MVLYTHHFNAQTLPSLDSYTNVQAMHVCMIANSSSVCFSQGCFVGHVRRPRMLGWSLMHDINYSRIRDIYVLCPCVVGFTLRNIRYLFGVHYSTERIGPDWTKFTHYFMERNGQHTLIKQSSCCNTLIEQSSYIATN